MKTLGMAVLVLLMLSGCMQFPKQVVITRYDANGRFSPWADATTGGCGIAAKGDFPPGTTITYKDDKCQATYTTDSTVYYQPQPLEVKP